MSHEINDKAMPNNNKAESSAEGLNLLSVNETDRKVGQTSEVNENHSAMLEANEREIAATMERIAEIGRRALMFALCGESEHLDTMKESARKGAASNEPAYVAIAKQIC